MSRKKENGEIFYALLALERNYNLRVDALEKFVEVNGFKIMHDSWCYVILKPTDISKEPQHKGEDLVKIIPETVKLKKVYVDMVLNSQCWTYY